jgi:O-methyltransferase involved in polyketide biosynthesis
MAPSQAVQIAPGLANVGETMLWALHNRATEAARTNGVLTDPDCLQIHQSIDYDYDRNFGPQSGSLAARAAQIDQTLKRWISRHPDGTVVSLGEGLETQVRRVDNGRVKWLSVDLPDAISLRAHFIPPTDRFRHIAVSALDPAWMDHVDPSEGVFIVAQGLLMYLQPRMVQQLFAAIAHRFPTAEMVFDAVPRWFSHLTMLGLQQTANYRLPPMPWGINRDEIRPTLRRWLPGLAAVTFLDYRMPRGLHKMAADSIRHVPVLRHNVPTLVHLALAGDPTHTQRKTKMSSFTGVLDAAADNAASTNDLAAAAHDVIVKRVALATAAAFAPHLADHTEFTRMVPEKIEAFSAAGMIMLEKSNHAVTELTRLATNEVHTTARAALTMADWINPVAIAQAQQRFALAWVKRATTNFYNMGLLALSAQKAAMAPIQETIAENAKRLAE